MGNKESVGGVVTNAYQTCRDLSDLLESLMEMNAESRKTLLETKIKDGDDLLTALIIAARDGSLDIVRDLLCYEADIEAHGTIKINEEIIEGCTALWVAAAKGHLNVVKLLIERNAEVDSRTSIGSTPLRVAAFFGRLDIVSFLCENGANVKSRTINNSTPLMIACYNGHMDVASYLVEHGADVHVQDNNGDTCLHFAARKGHVQIVGELLAFGAKQERNLICLTPLLEASNNCNIEMVEYLINRPECTKEQRIDALELLGATIAKFPCIETMKLILHAGCDVNAANTVGNSPLHLAVTFKPGPEQGDTLKEMLELLLDFGADTNLANNNGKTAMVCCETEEAREMLRRGSRVKKVDTKADEISGSEPGKGRRGGIVPRAEKETSKTDVSGKIGESTQQLENIREELRERDGQLSEMTQQLTNVEGQLVERDNQLREKTQQLTNVQGQLRERDGQLMERTQQLANVRGQLVESDGRLTEMIQEYTNVEDQLREGREQLRQMTEHSTKVEEQLREKKEQVRQLAQQLKHVQRQSQDADRQLRENNRQLREMTEQMANARQQIQQLENIREKRREREGQLREMTQQLIIIREQLQEKDGEVNSLEGRLRAKEQEKNELENTLFTVQQALSESSRQQMPDWIIQRDQIQLTDNELGKGAWGRVVEGKYCGCAVAVKQMHHVLRSSLYRREPFEREMNIASRCRHPCLLQFIGATNDDGSPLFVTELMEKSLRNLLDERPLSSTEVSVISLDVARALNYLHKKKPCPIIHRDISSANVLLWRHTDQWRGKVSDYGTANFMQQSMSVGPGAIIYSAPEAFTEHQTVKVDVYSFGVLLCEICIRRQPSRERREKQVAMVTDRVLRVLIRRCLQEDPEARPSMEEILSELEKLI